MGQELIVFKVFESLWHLNKIHEHVTKYAFFGTWENMRHYGLFPTEANRALREYEEGWEKFNLDLVRAARETNTPCRAERIFQVVESGEITITMVGICFSLSRPWLTLMCIVSPVAR